MSSFRRAAASLKASLALGRGDASASAHVAGMSVAIEQNGRLEMVSLRLQNGALAIACTCGVSGCAHAREALALFDEDVHTQAHDERITHVFEPGMRVSEPAPMPNMSLGAPAPLREGRASLAGALSDLVLAVTRSGLRDGISPAVTDTLDRIAEHAPSATATGLRVFVGNLKSALEARHADGVVQALSAASAMIDALLSTDKSAANDARIATWLGTAPASGVASDRVTERAYVEIAREQRPGLARAGVERRYLIGLEAGELYREDRAAGETASVGPCPRLVSLGLAHIEPGIAPRRMRLLQYTTTPVIDGETWDRIAGFALPSFASLLERYKQHATQSAELTDLVALVKPARLESDERMLVLDDEGHALGLRGAEGSSAALEAFFGLTEPQWMLGRVFQEADSLSLVPLAAGGRKQGRPTHLQL